MLIGVQKIITLIVLLFNFLKDRHLLFEYKTKQIIH